MNTRTGIGLGVGVLAISWAAIFIRLAHAPPLTTAAWRLTFAGVPLLFWVLLRRREELRAMHRRTALLLGAGGVALALHFATWVSSLDYTSVASSVAIVTTTPIWVSLIERPPRQTVLGMAIAMAGSVFIAGTDFALDPRALQGDALALAGAIFSATYLSIGKKVRVDLDLTTYVGVVYPVAGLCLVGAALASGSPFIRLEPASWVWLVALAVVPQLIGHSLLNWALKHTSAALVAIAILGEPIFSTLLAIPILKEVPGPTRIIGAAIVLTGVAIAAWSESRAQGTGSVRGAREADL